MQPMASTFAFRTTHLAPLAADDPNERLYASEEGRAAPLSAEEYLFVVKNTGAPHILTVQVLQALDACREFRRLDEHVARIEATVQGLSGKHDDIRRVLVGLIQRKVLLGDDDFIAGLRRGQARALAPMRAVFIRACDRPDRLGHLLASLVDYERRHRAGRRYVLIDDSAEAKHCDAQRDLFRDFARTTGCDARYVGSAEALQLVDALASIHPRARNAAQRLLLREAHPQTLRFAGGRSRNLALLLSAGSRFALLDDDLRLPLRRPEFATTGLEPDPDASACTRFCSSMDEALRRGGSDVAEDPFELHLQACGQTLATCVEEKYSLRRDLLRGVNLSRLELLKPDARVVSTHHGSYGSSRSESTLWLYHTLDPAGREEFWRDRESYTRNTQAHHIVYGAKRARVLEVPGFTPFTMDNSELLPFTNPVGRAEDSLAAALTHYCLPDSVSLELHVAIGHVQESLRALPSNNEACVPRVNDFLRDFVVQQFGNCKTEDAGERLGFLSHVLRDLARAPVKDRVEHLEEHRRFVHARLVNRLQEQLDTTAAAPSYWQTDVRAIVQANVREMLASGAVPRLAEWSRDIDASGCAQALSDELDAMADACEHWPALWRHAAEQGDSLMKVFA